MASELPDAPNADVVVVVEEAADVQAARGKAPNNQFVAIDIFSATSIGPWSITIEALV